MADEFSGPSDLARVVSGFVEPLRRIDVKPVIFSDQSIAEVLHVAYGVSFMPEEGRYPSFTIMVDLSGDIPYEKMATFNPPLSLTTELLSKLSPAIGTYPHCVLITEQDGKPIIVAIDPNDYDHLLMAMSYKILLVSIRGPGSLQAITSDPMLIYMLQGGAIRQLKPLSGSQVSEEADQAFRFDDKLSFSFWIQTLQRILMLQHGGVIVRMPVGSHDDFDSVVVGMADQISVGYQVQPYRNLMDLFMSHHMQDIKSSIVAHMSQVDGCVILANDFSLIGFGARLRVDVASIPDCVDFHGESPSLHLSLRGMRHRSAARFAFDVPGATVAVVSQDGDIHVFRRNDGEDVLTVYGPFGDVPLLSPNLPGRSV